MAPNAHALLSASSAHRWLCCTPSARLEQEFEDRETEAAAEGTAAHALCEHKLRRLLKQRSKKPVSKYDSDEMDGYTDDYVQFVAEAITESKNYCKDPTVLIEQRLDFSCYVPEGFGTGDCIIVSDKLLHIIDFKYGQGVLVEAEENPQMMLYALGALRLFDSLYSIDTVSMTIFQPRRENVSTWTIGVDELKEWADKTLNKAALKLPLRDGDVERDDEAYQNSYFVNANSPTAPQIVDRTVQPILDRNEVYSGCYARVSINFYAFNSNGNKGIACGLGNIQKVKDGEQLGGKSSAVDDFSSEIDDSFDDFLS